MYTLLASVSLTFPDVEIPYIPVLVNLVHRKTYSPEENNPYPSPKMAGNQVVVECADAQDFAGSLFEGNATSVGKRSLVLTSSPLLGGTIRFRHSISRMSIGGSRAVNQRNIFTILGCLILDLALFSFAPIVLGNTREDETVRDAEDEEQPEQIECLKGRQQRGGDELRKPALVLASCPIQLVGSHGAELGEDGENDLQVKVVAQVDPDTHKAGKVRALPSAVNVVQGL